MLRKILMIGMVLAMSGAALAVGEEVTVTGYVLDSACAVRTSSGDDAAEKVVKHPKACSLMPDCAKNGFAVVADGKVYKLDEEGNKKAMAVLKSSSAKAGIKVKVKGELDGDTIKVSEISEVKSE